MLNFIEKAIKIGLESDDEVPVGCIIVHNNVVIVQTHNMMKQYKSTLAHAEMLAIHQAVNLLNTPYLYDCDIYISLEPCPMCAQAIVNSRFRRVYYCCNDEQNTITRQILLHNKVEFYEGFNEQSAIEMLQKFFVKKRTFKS
jgi:tRNA(adenine34) deaminase